VNSEWQSDALKAYKQTEVMTGERTVLSRATWNPLGTDHFHSPQPYTSLHSETTDSGIVHHIMCLYTPQLLLILLGWPSWVYLS